MKKIIALSLIAVVALAWTPQRAVASNRSDKVFAAVGGLITGIIIANASHERDCPPPSRATHTVVYRDGCDHRECAGYWKQIEVRTWVPGYWTMEHRYGRRVRCYVEGHYEISTERVWVPAEHRVCRLR